MKTYVIEKITEDAAKMFENWDEVLTEEENNTEIIAEFNSYEEAVKAFERDGFDTDMYCVGIRK